MLLDAMNKINENVDYETYLKEWISATPAISNFFDKVLVMDNDEQVKNNRLAMLTKLNEKFEKLCDFSKIQAQFKKEISRYNLILIIFVNLCKQSFKMSKFLFLGFFNKT